MYTQRKQCGAGADWGRFILTHAPPPTVSVDDDEEEKKKRKTMRKSVKKSWWRSFQAAVCRAHTLPLGGGALC